MIEPVAYQWLDTAHMRKRIPKSSNPSEWRPLYADKPKSFGRDDLMVLAAVRYCMGRMTYIVGDCVDWLIDEWDNISPSMQRIIQRDIEDEFRRDDEARQRGESHRPLGMDIDRASWEKVRRLWK